MKPTIEYRAPAAPKKVTKGVPRSKPVNKPEPGQWIWLRPDQIVSKRPERREYMRAYMQKYRKKAKAV